VQNDAWRFLDVRDTKQRLLRLPAVMDRTGYGKSKLYQLIRAQEFPQPIKLGKRSTAWVEDEVSAWVTARIRAARAA
jgi:prophage regulatory protein